MFGCRDTNSIGMGGKWGPSFESLETRERTYASEVFWSHQFLK